MSQIHQPGVASTILKKASDLILDKNVTSEFQNQILFEHLIFARTPEGEFMIPDGSYEGYVYSEGKWVHNAKVSNQTQDEPLFPEPILNGKENKDMFGNPVKRSSINPNRSKKYNEAIRKRNEKLRKEKNKQNSEQGNN